MPASRSLLVALVCALFVSAATVPSKQTAKAELILACTVPNTVAITFDDGPYVDMNFISDQFTAAGAKATFFLNGNNYDCIYDDQEVARIRHTYAQGHQIGNHLWTHPHMNTLNQAQLSSEMERVTTAIKKIIGADPAFMRPPYGEINDLGLTVVGAHNMTAVNWDFDSGDSVGATVAQSKATYDATLKAHPSTLLALNHETYATTAHQVVPYILPKFKAMGYKMVTVAECLGRAPYLSVGAPSAPDDSWTC